MLEIPDDFVACLVRYNGSAGAAFAAALPARAAHRLDAWDLRPDGPARHGMTALVLPVTRSDGTQAALKLGYPDDETEGEPGALRRWDGDGAVRLLAHAPGALLLERLDAARDLDALPTRTAVPVIAGLLARLTAHPAPPGTRRLGTVAARLLGRARAALPRLADPDTRALLGDCAAALRDVAAEPAAAGDRLLHWDLHFRNVLAGEREPWLAIDPKPLAGHPGFELYPALHNRFDPAETHWRFDALTDVLAVDRERARAWTLARALQSCLAEAESGAAPAARHLTIADQLRHPRPPGPRGTATLRP